MRSETKFKVGDKVKRIDIGDNPSCYKRISYNKIYTISKIKIYPMLREDTDIVYLKGFSLDEGMWARRFVKAGK